MSYTDFIAALPLIIIAATALIIMLIDAFEKTPTQTGVYLMTLGCLGAISAAFMNMTHNSTAFGGLYYDTAYSNFFTICFSAAALLAGLLSFRYLQNETVMSGEFCALTLFAAAGMILMASGANLIITFLGLETMSISFYILSGMFRRKEESNESALKYFLLGAFATGFFLYGIALIYGSYATLSFEGIRAATERSLVSDDIALIGVLLFTVGLLFKVSAFPFHQWAPDVYEGAPTIVSGFMSSAGKAAAFSVFIHLTNTLLRADQAIYGKITILLTVLSAASMLYGNITAIRQSKIKRMLAYSSIAHAGYLLLGVSSMNAEGMTGIIIYSAVYILMQTAAFAVVAILEKETGRGLEIEDYSGLAKRRPNLALLFALIMFSLAGIPPFAGFFGKYYLFMSALNSGLIWLVIAGVISSIIGAYFYLRVIVLMYFREPDMSVEMGVDRIDSSFIGIAFAVIALLVFGILPELLLRYSSYVFAK